MATTIIKSKNVDGYYINGRGVLLDNWDFHKKTGFFSPEEIKAFDNYLTTIKK